MPEPEAEVPEGGEQRSDHPDQVQEEQVATDTPVRNIDVVQFFEPGADPVATHDFRPSSFVFKDGDGDHPADEALEDGHGNFKHPSQPEPRHPSLPRVNQPYDRREEPEGQEGSEAAPPKQGSPFAT